MILSPAIAKRQKVERRIVRAVVRDALRAGFDLNVNNGGDEHELPVPSRKVKKILDAMFATDDEYLRFYKDGKCVGWVHFVYGNDGWDVLADYTMNLEDVLVDVNKLVDKLGG